jgi:hypothetical protein
MNQLYSLVIFCLCLECMACCTPTLTEQTDLFERIREFLLAFA